MRVPKNNGKSEEFRKKGNSDFSQLNVTGIVKALRWYNKSICFAENDSKELALGYANRSAVYFQMKMFKECLANIELARSVEQYPESLNEKLVTRETKCRTLMATTKFDIDPVVPKLSYPAHGKIPFVANCVEMRHNEKFGRHLVTNRDLRIGDIVAIEKPYCTVVSGRYRYDQCENCTEEHSRSLIPCELCTAVMFCSVECRTEAMQNFHQYECEAIDMIKNVIPLKMLPVRLTLSALSSFDGDSWALYDYAETADSNSDEITIFDIDYTKRLTPFGKFAPIYGMIKRGETKRAPGGPIGRSPMNVLCSILQHCKSDEPTIQHLMKIMEHFSNIHSVTVRIHNTGTSKLDTPWYAFGLQYAEHSHGVYPFRYLFNHSCLPNVIRVPYGNQSVMMVTRAVKAGGQLFDCYSTPFYMNPRDERRRLYSFFCRCEACERNFPMMYDLPWCPIMVPQSIRRFVDTEHVTRKRAMEMSKVIAEYLKRINNYMLSKDWVYMQVAFRACSLVMYEKSNLDILQATDKYLNYGW